MSHDPWGHGAWVHESFMKVLQAQKLWNLYYSRKILYCISLYIMMYYMHLHGNDEWLPSLLNAQYTIVSQKQNNPSSAWKRGGSGSKRNSTKKRNLLKTTPPVVESCGKTPWACCRPALQLWTSLDCKNAVGVFQWRPQFLIHWGGSALLEKNVFQKLLCPGLPFTHPDSMRPLTLMRKLLLCTCSAPSFANSSSKMDLKRLVAKPR